MHIPRSHVLALTVVTFSGAALAPSVSHAHFVLESPAVATEQNGLGDPQKAPPCGDDGSAVKTGDVTTYSEGSTITITLNETIYHPGHYRVALAVNDISELPAEPPVTAGDTDCGSTVIQTSPVFPVLADGMLLHTSAFSGSQSFEVTLPEGVTCTNCTLQIIEFMSDHRLNVPGGCFYHHCANITITGDGKGASDAGSEPPDNDPTGDGDGDTNPADSEGGGCAVHPGKGSASFVALLGVVGLLFRQLRKARRTRA
jgi:hypothetical protein